MTITKRIPFAGKWLSSKGSNGKDEDFGMGTTPGMSATPGTGIGKGGGGGGSIRSAGGALGKMAATQEEAYFHKKTMEALEKLHEDMEKSIETAGKMAQSELDKDRKVEEKMKNLSVQLKNIIEEGKSRK